MNMGEREVRLGRLQSLEKNGIDPYPSEVKRTHTVDQVLAVFEALLETKEQVTIVGRARALRNIGALTFLRVEDGTGLMQAVLKKDDLGDAYKIFADHADVGDFFEVTGTAFVTKTGEKSILASGVRFLAKAIMPLPEKWHGLQDIETRYRHRELDLISNAEVKSKFVVRSKFLSALRRFLDERGFLEVETPMLQPIPGGATARPFVTHHNALDADFYLRIAPELYLKRLVVGGFEKIYEIGRCFRNEGIDYSHNPEFTMIEMYQAYVNKDEYIDLIENMLRYSIEQARGKEPVEVEGTKIDFFSAWPRVTFRDAIKNASGLDIDELKTPEVVMEAAKTKNIRADWKGCVGLGDYYDTLYKATARPGLVQPTWVFDYPIDLKPLAKRHPEDATKSASAQLVVMGAEIVNAYYHDLNDPVDQRQRLEEQQALRDQGSQEAQWMDTDFLQALETGLPPLGGMGLGIDRIAALITGSHNLKEVILFPTLKPKNLGTEGESV
ncbi:MAG: lysine--tRNA ligase [Patescibacteria group bacterium]